MALPAAAVIQATVSSYLTRHEVVETRLTMQPDPDVPSQIGVGRRRSLFSWIRRRGDSAEP
jgi:hypothetical protein